MGFGIYKAIRDAVRLLTFRLTPDEFAAFDNRHLAFGLFCTWLVGVGRWWDDPGANVLQHLGLGSIVYIFVLALVLCLVTEPLEPENWSYKQVLTLVSLTSPPAILYAIPVERFTELAVARELNVWFLAAVAIWRLALLLYFLKRIAGLPAIASIVVALLPIIAIITTLTFLNLERATFDIMGGLRQTGTANDSAYGFLFGLTIISVILFVPLVVCYVVLIYLRKRR